MTPRSMSHVALCVRDFDRSMHLSRFAGPEFTGGNQHGSRRISARYLSAHQSQLRFAILLGKENAGPCMRRCSGHRLIAPAEFHRLDEY
jgi:hypothetical protein